MPGLRSLLVAGAAVAGAQNLRQRAHTRPAPSASYDESVDVKVSLDTADKMPLINSKAIQALVTSEALFARAEKLYEVATLSNETYGHPTRVIGSPGFNGTIDYIKAVISGMSDYYTLSTQDFNVELGQIFEASLTLDGEAAINATAMENTPSTPNKETISGNLVLVSNIGCDLSDFPPQVAGNIALIERGTCTFSIKSANAGQAGAVAAVVYNNVEGSFSSTLGTADPNHVPTFALPREDALPYVQRLQANETLTASALVDAEFGNVTVTNVIAQTIGGDQDNCVMAGGHSDSVVTGPGINDDGSGTASLLEVATLLSGFRVKNCVRLAWWAAEEEGLLGSEYYVSQLSPEENLKIRMFQDYDMMASPNFAYQVYDANNEANPVGSGELKALYIAFYESLGLNYTLKPFDGRSDYDAFINNGIPGGGVATGAEGVKTAEEAEVFGGVAGEWYDWCYHMLCDDLSNVNMTAWTINTKLIAHSIATYALSFDGFPERTPLNSTVYTRAAKAKMPTMYHGHTAVM